MIYASGFTNEALQDYDALMLECALRVEMTSSLAFEIWGEVLRELNVRGLVQLVSGSYDDLGHAHVRRLF